MWSLILRDLRVSALLVAAIAFAWTCMGLAAVRRDELFFWLAVFLAVSLWVIVPILEWQDEADRFLCSLPVARSTIVRARAAWAVAANLAAGLAWAGARHVGWWAGLGPGSEQAAMPPWGTADGLLAFGLVSIVLAGMFLPCYFRFGIGKGGAAFTALAAVAIAAIAGLGAVAPAAPSSPVSGLAGSGLQPAGTVVGIIGRVRGGIGGAATLALVVAVAAVVLWGSITVSARGYARREF